VHRPRGGLLLQGLGVLQEFVGVPVRPGDVRARRSAAVQARGVGDVQPVAQGPVPVVDAHQERLRVVADGQGRIVQDLSGLSVRAERPGEGGSLGGGVDRTPGSRSRDPRPGGEVVVEVSDRTPPWQATEHIRPCVAL
jgi:hypothetical protein